PKPLLSPSQPFSYYSLKTSCPASQRAIKHIPPEPNDGGDVEQQNERAERECDGNRAVTLPTAPLQFALQALVPIIRHPDTSHPVINSLTRCSPNRTANSRNR